ncbi:MAG: hypothetical protein WDM76_16750 [Limisphaerales bacterium]
MIYPGKISRAETFRIGNIGHLFEADIIRLLTAIGEVAADMQLQLESPEPMRANGFAA